jgi:hypothetical protein
MVKVINLTPHDITVIAGEGEEIVFPRCSDSSKLVRASVTRGQISSI